jgi:hypothetical protein
MQIRSGARGGRNMPAEIRHICIADFLRTDLSGVFDFDATKALFTDIFQTSIRSGVARVLVDARLARPPHPADIDVSDIYTLVMHLLSLGLDPSYKLAILNDPPGAIDRGKLFEECAVQNGMQVAAFRDFEEALAWLNEGRL